MKITIGKYNKECDCVPVTFEQSGISHQRFIAAVRTGGKYDARATALRVDDVARGVEAKIASGAIACPPHIENSGDAAQ